MSPGAEWRTYEEVAVYLLNKIADALELEFVEGKQKVSGQSGTAWEIDGKGAVSGGEGFVILECRRYTKSKQTQEQAASLAFRIIDTGASGGIFVSPLGLQAGASKVAAATNIKTVRLDANSTTTDYVVRFLNRIWVGIEDDAGLTDEVRVTLLRGPSDPPGTQGSSAIDHGSHQ